MARRLTTILPEMTLAEAIETTRIHGVAGLSGDRTARYAAAALGMGNDYAHSGDGLAACGGAPDSGAGDREHSAHRVSGIV
jgi:predicted ATPase with chaperone activity